MTEAQVLLYTAATIAVLHTVLGPDHYLVFTAMGKAQNWSLAKTLRITTLCGLGHVASSMLLGLAGILLLIGPEASLPDPAMAAFIPLALVAPLTAVRGALPAEVQNLPKDKRYTVMCASGARATVAASVLMRHGFDSVALFLGSMGAWKSRGYETDR